MPCFFSIAIATSLYADPLEGPYIGITANKVDTVYTIELLNYKIIANTLMPEINIGYRWTGTSFNFTPEFSLSPGYKTIYSIGTEKVEYKTTIAMYLNLHIGYILSERAAAKLSLGLRRDKAKPILNNTQLESISTNKIKYGFGLEYAYSPKLLIHMENTIMPAKKIRESKDYVYLTDRSENIVKIGFSYFF